MKALLVDGPNLVRRIHAAVPEPKDGSEESHAARVITANVSSLERALRFHQPSHVLAVFETSAPSWRNRYYPDYRKKRAPMPERLQRLLPDLREAFLASGVHSLERDGYEASDIIATIASKISVAGGHSTILTTDRHYCQLLSAQIRVYDHFGQRFLDREMIHERFGIDPGKLLFFLALTGDSGKSIPGIPGIGPHTASRLVAKHEDLESLLKSAGKLTGSLGSKVRTGSESARTALTLFQFRTDIDLGINLNQFRHHSPE